MSTLSEGLEYFARFGVDDVLIRAALSRALSRGGDFAELYFEHRVAHDVGLEDGAVNLVEATFVDAEDLQPCTCRVLVDGAVAADFGEVAHTAQQTVGDTRRAARTASNLPCTLG